MILYSGLPASPGSNAHSKLTLILMSSCSTTPQGGTSSVYGQDSVPFQRRPRKVVVQRDLNALMGSELAANLNPNVSLHLVVGITDSNSRGRSGRCNLENATSSHFGANGLMGPQKP